MIKRCKECKKELSYDHFYVKGKTTSGSIKRDTICKACKSRVQKRLTKLYGPSGTKSCTKCTQKLPWSEFSFRIQDGNRYLRSTCKSCNKLKWDAWVSVHPEYKDKKREVDRRAHEAYKKYHRRGITKEEYALLFEQQDGVCAICFKPSHDGQDLAIDHNHHTNEVRGLLCKQCNRALGLFGDSISRLQQATIYLQQRGSYGWKQRSVHKAGTSRAAEKKNPGGLQRW